MKKGFFIFFCALTFANAHAMLPPFYTIRQQFIELIENEQLAQKLDASQMIQSIQRTDTGFVVTTNKAVLVVDVVREEAEPGRVGPMQFHLVFHDPIPLSQELQTSP